MCVVCEVWFVHKTVHGAGHVRVYRSVYVRVHGAAHSAVRGYPGRDHTMLSYQVGSAGMVLLPYMSAWSQGRATGGIAGSASTSLQLSC